MASQANRRESTAKGYHTRRSWEARAFWRDSPMCVWIAKTFAGRKRAAGRQNPPVTGSSPRKRWLSQATFRAQEVFGFFEGALQVGGGLDPAEPGADAHKGVGDDGRNAGEDDFGSQKLHGLNGPDKTVCGFRFNFRNPGEIDHDGARAVRVHGIEKLVAQLCGT